MNATDQLLIEVAFSPSSVLAGIAGTYDCLELGNGQGHFLSIPKILRDRKNWVWLDPCKGVKPKTPHLCRGVGGPDALKPCNWLGPINDIAYLNRDGAGYVLTDEIIQDGCRLVVIQITPESGLSFKQVDDLWLALGKPYLEHSIESQGWTLLGLVNREFPTYQMPGLKITCINGYIELSGLGGRGELKDITQILSGFHGFKAKKPSYQQPATESPRKKAQLIAMLKHITADCTYEIYRNVVWAILSTGWDCAEQLALDWSLSAAHRFGQRAFDNLISSYDSRRINAPTLGTIYHMARLGGWDG